MERVRLYGSGKWICLLFTLFHPYHQFKEPSIGLQLATELGTIALLTNIFREMMTLLGTPIIKKYFGKLAPISAAGVNSMDVLLPSITRYSGKEMIPIAILHGILIDISVPVFVSFFCNL